MEIIRLGNQVLTFRQHWRVLVAVIVAIAAWFLLWTISFPHTFWFSRFWGSNVIGLPAGAVAGACWQRRRDPGFRLLTSDRAVFAFVAIVFILYAVFGLGRDLASQERVLRNIRLLGGDEITSIACAPPGSAKQRFESPEAIEAFKKILTEAELFSPNHERRGESFTVEIRRRGHPPYSLRVEIWEHHLADLVMTFNQGFGFHHVLFPGAAKWMNSPSPELGP